MVRIPNFSSDIDETLITFWTAAVVIGTLKAHIDRLTVEIDEIDTDIEESQALVLFSFSVFEVSLFIKRPDKKNWYRLKDMARRLRSRYIFWSDCGR